MTYAHHGSVDIYFETFGDPANPALLNVNGLGGQCISFDEDLCESFVDRGLFVIRFDNRDVGLSTKFDDVTPRVADVLRALRDGTAPTVAYRLSDMANDAVAVLDALGVNRAHVAGASLGGMIVQQLAIDHPERLRSMISIMSTTGDPDVGKPSHDAWARFNTRPATDRASYIQNQVDLYRVVGSPEFFDSDYVAARAGAAFDRCFCPWGRARQYCASLASGSRSAGLRAVRVPALVVHGDQDTLIDISGGRRTAECIPGARFVAIEGMGHDYPRALRPQLVELIAGHAAANL